MLSVFLVLCAFAPSPSGGKLVTADIPAASADKVLAQLSKRSGLTLRAGERVRKDILIVSVKDCPADQILSTLAFVTNGTWQGSGPVRTLERSKEQEDREKAQEAEARGAEIQQGLWTLEWSLRRPWTEEEVSRLLRLFQKDEGIQTPLEKRQIEAAGAVPRALARCLRDVPLADLQKLEDGERIVFSTEPKAGQHPLGKNAQEALRALHEEQDVWARVLKKEARHPLEEDETLGDRGDLSPYFGHYPWARTKPFSVTKLVLGASYEREEGLGLRLVGEDSKSVAFDFRYAVPKSDEGSTPSLERIGTVSTADLSRETLAYIDLQKSDTKPEARPEDAFRILKPWLFRPDLHEPLGLLTSDILIGNARAKGLNLVGLLSDDQFVGDTFGTGDPDPYFHNDPSLIRTGNWLLIKPPLPSQTRALRADRVALAAVAKLLTSVQTVTVEAEAQRWRASGTLAHDHFSAQFLPLITPSNTDWFDLRPRYVVDLYASLSAAQRAQLAAGGSLAPHDLNAEQRTRLRKAMLATSTTYGPETRWNRWAPLDLQDVPANTVLRAPMKGHRSAYVCPDSDPRKGQFFADLDFNGPLEEKVIYTPGAVEPAVQIGQLDGAYYYVVSHERVDVSIKFPGGIPVEARLEAPETYPLPKPVKLKDLPKDVRTLVLKYIAEAKAFDAEVRGPGG